MKAPYRSPRSKRPVTGDAFISQCCQITTIPRRVLPSKCAIPSGAWPQGDQGIVRRGSLIAAAIHLNVQVAYLLAQRVAIEPEQVGGADLIAPGCRQRRRQQRHFDFLEDAVIEA